MGGSTKRFTHESLQDSKTIKTLLSSLAKGFSKGEMTLGDEGDELVLRPDGLMNVRIKADREDGKSTVSLRVTWSDPAEPDLKKGAPRVES
ncbi:amphi-Trp domain-containing protein [Alloyangia pacifica]|uniref:amphi-Trp domain-containing protein n=1 Tax=Alloyangia pacifica TaxID=311180 RepID=UPI001CD456A4|nr:amphi-Trp domain-containing protein [Alloyangia pacifica]MCA0996640.1 amphi-Trp domain-containing protein [Alloyangia pacifica]